MAIIPLALAAAGVLLAQSPELPPGPRQQEAKTACMECHDGSLIVQQRLDQKAWAKEVDKMAKWGALVDAKDRDALIDYLSSNFGPEKPAYVPPRSVSGKSSPKSTARSAK